MYIMVLNKGESFARLHKIKIRDIILGKQQHIVKNEDYNYM